MNRIKLLLLIAITPILLFAKAQLQAPASFMQGDMVEFSIVVSGEDITIPQIKKIENYIVRASGNSTQTNIFNGKKTVTQIRSYAFSPKKDVTIPSFSIKIDGKTYKTKAKRILMKKVTKTKSKLYSFDLKVDKTKVYVGEAVKLTLEFKYRKDLNILNLEFEQPDFSGFWVKKLKSQTKDDNPTYFSQTLSFLLFPQKTGKIDIGAFKINVYLSKSNYSNSFFLTGSSRATPVYSNQINLDVQSLPSNVGLIGKFEIEASVDKTEVNAGEAISYKLNIKGEGNIDDIKELKPEIPNATIYDNPAKKESSFEDGKYKGEYTKVFSIVASEDFIIPEIELAYFDKETKSVKTLRTKAFSIKVKQAQNKQKVSLETAPKIEQQVQEVATKTFKKQSISIIHGLFFILGVFTTLAFLAIYKFFKLNAKKKEEDIPLLVQVKKANSPDSLLRIIVNYINIDKDLDKIIYQLENKNALGEFKRIKKEVIKIVKNTEISTF